MTKDLLARGGQIASIEDQSWKYGLKSEEKSNVGKVLEEIHAISEQGNDQPTVEDKFGRDDFARSLAGLLLNPYLEPPIAVGISGSWGKGKSSLMTQTEIKLLKTVAQSSLLPTPKLFLESSFPGAQVLELSGRGRKKYKEVQNWVDFVKNESNFYRNHFSTMIVQFLKWIRSIRGKLQTHRAETKESQGISTASKSKESQGKDSLFEFLHNYERKYNTIFKSLAAMDTSDMFVGIFKSLAAMDRSGMFSLEGRQPYTRIDPASDRSVPAVLTVQYNAWTYRNESEALAGLAVAVTKEMEDIMTQPQWLSTCLRNTWRKQKQSIWIDVLFPCLLAIFLAGTFTWIVWILMDRYYANEAVKLKYSSLPATTVIVVWIVVKSLMSIVKPVSTQLMNYIQLANHSERLGFQETVISDIKFLKEEIDTLASSKAVLGSLYYPSVNPRIVVFVDDLDRCQESVILQVLAAINLVLAVCKISVVIGMDKAMIERAIIKKYGDKSMKNNQQLADKYLQKIIQLPLDLPDPSEDESKRFLDAQLGVFSRQDKKDKAEADVEDYVVAEVDVDYDALFPIADRGREFEIRDLGDYLRKMFNPESSIRDAAMSGETGAVTKWKGKSSGSVAIDVTPRANTDSSRKSGTAHQSIGNVPLKPDAGNDQSLSVSMSIRDMLFVRYSEGERDAFCHFQTMDCQKLPREWKRLLWYHRFVWYILYMGNEVSSLLGWQVQLIAWVFTCCEWQENMNIIIQKWNSIDILRTSRSQSDKISLRAIVDHFIKEESWIVAEGPERSNRDQFDQVVKGMKLSNNLGDLESKKEVQPIEVVEDQKMGEPDNALNVSVTRDSLESKNRVMPQKLDDVLEKLREDVERIDKTVRKKMEELHKEIRKLKEVKHQSVKNKNSEEERKARLKTWKRMRSALRRYDVSMEGIRAFQRFRFYCVAGYLPWPLPEKENEDL